MVDAGEADRWWMGLDGARRVQIYQWVYGKKSPVDIPGQMTIDGKEVKGKKP